MDWKQFLAAMTSHLAWPIVAVIFIIMFKDKVGEIVERLSNLKLPGGLEAQFEQLKEQVIEFKQDVKQPVSHHKNIVEDPFKNHVFNLLESSPWAAIIAAWSGVENSLSKAVMHLSVSPPPSSTRSPIQNIKALESAGYIPHGVVGLLNELRKIRNTVAHQYSPDSNAGIFEKASEYVDIALTLMDQLEELQRGQDNPFKGQ